MNGFVEIGNKQLLFEFNDFELIIYNDDSLMFNSMFDFENPYKTIVFNGIVLKNTKFVTFVVDYVLTKTNHHIHKNYSSITFSISYYIIHTELELPSVDKIYFTSPKLSEFYNTLNLVEERTFEQTKFKKTDETLKKFELDLKENNVTLEFYIAQKLKPFSSEMNELYTIMSFAFKDSVAIDSLIDFYQLYRSFLNFVSYNVNLEDKIITLFTHTTKNFFENTSRSFEKTGYFEIGKVYFKNSLNVSSNREGIIQFDHIEKGIPKLFEDIYSDKIYLEHIWNSLNSKTFNYHNFGYVMQCFEEQYSRLGNELTLQKNANTIQIEYEVLQYLEWKASRPRYNSKEKKVFKKLMRAVSSEQHKPLETKLNEQIRQHKNIMLDIEKKIYNFDNTQNTQSIITRIVYNRNKFSHGEIQSINNEFIISDYYFMLYLCYTMVLANIGLDSEKIKKCLIDLKLSK